MENFITYLEFIGTIAFAASGALLGIRKGFDLFGIIIMGIITAVGGGILRDVLLGVTPPIMFSNPIYCIIAAITSVLMFLPFVKKIVPSQHWRDIIFIVSDSLGLAAFTVVAVIYTYQLGIDNQFLIVVVSVITGVGGGMLRDVFACEMPYIFRKHIYAVASLIGAVFCTCLYGILNSDILMAAGIAIIFIIRILSAVLKINLPRIRETDSPNKK